MKTTFRLLSALALIALAAGCANSSNASHSAGASKITGTVTYPAGANIPAGSSLAVYLMDNTWTSETVQVIHTEAFEPVPASGSAFSITFDPAVIKTDRRYTLGARITDKQGQPLYGSKGYLVLTRGGPKDGVNMTLTAVPGVAR